MNLDICFCNGTGCKKAETCERWMERVSRWEKKTGEKAYLIAFSDFWRSKECKHYWPVEKEEKK